MGIYHIKLGYIHKCGLAYFVLLEFNVIPYTIKRGFKCRKYKKIFIKVEE